MQHQSITAAAGHNLPPYWFADERALAIVEEGVRTGGACFGQRPHDFVSKYANQREAGVIFEGPLVDELQAIRKAALPIVDEAIDWKNDAHITYYRTQRTSVSDMLLAALDWRPNGGGSHDAGLYAFFCAIAAEREGAAA